MHLIKLLTAIAISFALTLNSTCVYADGLREWLSRAKDLLPGGVNYTQLRPAVEGALMNPSEFLEKYTDKGIVYYGENIFNLRNISEAGLTLPMGKRPSYGPGIYTTTFKRAVELANTNYDANRGIVVELKFKAEQPRILLVNQQLLDDPQFKKLQESLKDRNAVLLEIAKQFNIHGMISTGGVVMIFDPTAVDGPKSLADLAAPLIARVKTDAVPYYRSGEMALEGYKTLYEWAGDEAKANWVSPEMVASKSVSELLLSHPSNCPTTVRRAHDQLP